MPDTATSTEDPLEPRAGVSRFTLRFAAGAGVHGREFGERLGSAGLRSRIECGGTHGVAVLNFEVHWRGQSERR